MSYHSAEIFLYEPSIHPSPSHTTPTPFPSQRLDSLYACLLSAKSLLDIYTAQPLSAYSSLTVISLAQLGHACSTLFKLSLVDCPGWDLGHVRSTVNLGAYFSLLGGMFERAGEMIDGVQGVGCRESFPTGCARAMGRVKAWYEAKVEGGVEVEGVGWADDAGGMGMGMGFGYLDDLYWQEVMADMSFMQQ